MAARRNRTIRPPSAASEGRAQASPEAGDRPPDTGRSGFSRPVPPNILQAVSAFMKALNPSPGSRASAAIATGGGAVNLLAGSILATLLKLPERPAIRLLRDARQHAGKSRGRPKGKTSMPPMESIFVFLLRDIARIPKTEILRALERKESDTPWLDRRIEYGRQLAKEPETQELVEYVRSLPLELRTIPLLKILLEARGS
jgi:hypothetical protein